MKNIFLFVILSLVSIIALNSVLSQQDHQVYIGKGWNLISYTEDFAKHDFSNTILAAYWFDPLEKVYYQIGPKNEFEPHLEKYGEDFLFPRVNGEDRYIFQNHAIWVYSEKQMTAEIEEIYIAPLNKVKLYHGWNLLTVSQDMADVQIKDLPGNCNIEKVYFFNPQEQIWFKVESDDDFERNQVGMGVAIRVKDDCSFEKSKSAISPPPEIPTD